MTVGSLSRAMNRADDMLRRVREDRVEKARSALELVTYSGTAGYPHPRDRSRGDDVRRMEHLQGTVFQCANVIMNRVAGQPMLVARKNPRRSLRAHEKAFLPSFIKSLADSAGLDLLEEHQFLSDLHKPNDFMHCFELIQWVVGSRLLTGRAFLLFAKSKREGHQWDIFPIPSGWVEESHDRQKGDWVIRARGDAEPFYVWNESLIIVRQLHPEDPYVKVTSPTHASESMIETEESIRASQKHAFDNGMNPQLAITVGSAATGLNNRDRVPGGGDGMGRPALESWHHSQIISRLNQLFRGPQKHGTPIILDAIIQDVKPISLKPAEMDWLNSFSMNQQSIELIFGVNPITAGRVEGANRASATVADELLCSVTVNPIIRGISEAFNYRIPKLYRDDRLVVFMQEARPNDPEGRRAELDMLFKNGALTKNELRAETGRAPLPPEIGNVIAAPAMMLTQPVDALPVREQEADESAEDEEVKRRSSRRKALGAQWLKVHERLEAGFARDLKSYFSQQADQIARNVEQGAAVPFDPSTWDDGIRKLASTHLVRCAAAGAEMELARNQKSADTHIDIPEPVLRAIHEGISNTLAMPYWGDMNDETARMLQTAMRESLKQGMSLTEQVAYIRSYLGERNADARAVNTARTETTGAMNCGAHAVIEGLADEGTVSEKTWLATVDSDTRDSHEAANGQTVNARAMFNVGGELAPYPGWHGLSPKQRCRCRCAVIGE